MGLWMFEGFRAEELKLLVSIIEALSSVGASWAFGVCPVQVFGSAAIHRTQNRPRGKRLKSPSMGEDLSIRW